MQKLKGKGSCGGGGEGDGDDGDDDGDKLKKSKRKSKKTKSSVDEDDWEGDGKDGVSRWILTDFLVEWEYHIVPLSLGEGEEDPRHHVSKRRRTGRGRHCQAAL